MQLNKQHLKNQLTVLLLESRVRGVSLLTCFFVPTLLSLFSQKLAEADAAAGSA
jgi:hypothetical protein